MALRSATLAVHVGQTATHWQDSSLGGHAGLLQQDLFAAIFKQRLKFEPAAVEPAAFARLYSV